MTKKSVTRRDFIGRTAAGLAGVAVSSGGSSLSAAFYKRIIGANDRINIGFLGCGSRSSGHQNMVPNGNIHTGFWHSIACIMATKAYREGRKFYWDRTKEVIVDHPVIS